MHAKENAFFSAKLPNANASSNSEIIEVTVFFCKTLIIRFFRLHSNSDKPEMPKNGRKFPIHAQTEFFAILRRISSIKVPVDIILLLDCCWLTLSIFT